MKSVTNILNERIQISHRKVNGSTGLPKLAAYFSKGTANTSGVVSTTARAASSAERKKEEEREEKKMKKERMKEIKWVDR